MDMPQNVTIDSISSFLAHIKEIKNKNEHKMIWFRGESQSYDSTLIPSLLRGKYSYEIEEQAILFAKKNYMRKYPYFSNFNWLCFVQHYTSNTRLLDWTTSPLTALLFSLLDTKDKDFSHVYAIFPYDINKKVFNSSKINNALPEDHIITKIWTEMSFSNDKDAILDTIFNYTNNDRREIYRKAIDEHGGHPIAIWPGFSNDRIETQHGCFTLHGHLKSPRPILNDTPFKFSISDKNKENILEELSLINYTESTLYPEPETRMRIFIEEQHQLKK